MGLSAKASYAKSVIRSPEKLLNKINGSGKNIYFINYKNSLLGTGGVGTTTREMSSLLENLKFVYYDKNIKNGLNNDSAWNVDLTLEEADSLHGVYAKLYLWPLLHGIATNVDEESVNTYRLQAAVAAKKFAVSAYNFALKHENDHIYWINDYVLAPVISFLRELDPKATVIFSLRTPFGLTSSPIFTIEDRDFVIKSMLFADLVTFHRKQDMKNFLESAQPYINSVKDSKHHSATVGIEGRSVRLRVVPMGSNYNYRRILRSTNRAYEIEQEYKLLTKGRVMIAGVSRFEKSKGIDYEIRAYEQLLKTHPELKEKVQFVRFSYMSDQKKNTDYYVRFRALINAGVIRINKKYSTDNWTPIIARFDMKLTDEEVTGVLRAADILFIGSYADGFNHLAMEGIFSHDTLSPIKLVLGDIGARDYIKGYYGFSHDPIESATDALYRAITAGRFRGLLRSFQMNQSRLYSIKSWIIEIIFSAIEISQIKDRERKNG